MEYAHSSLHQDTLIVVATIIKEKSNREILVGRVIAVIDVLQFCLVESLDFTEKISTWKHFDPTILRSTNLSVFGLRENRCVTRGLRRRLCLLLIDRNRRHWRWWRLFAYWKWRRNG